MVKQTETGLWGAEIDGLQYEFQKWGADDSLRVLSRIARIIAEPAGVVIGNLVVGSKGDIKKLLDFDFDEDMIAKAIRSLMLNLDEDVNLALIKKISSEGVMCNGAKISFNTHFQDKLDHLYDVVLAGLEVQYGNFLGALLVRLKHLMPVRKKTTSNQASATSTGQSGRR